MITDLCKHFAKICLHDFLLTRIQNFWIEIGKNSENDKKKWISANQNYPNVLLCYPKLLHNYTKEFDK